MQRLAKLRLIKRSQVRVTLHCQHSLRDTLRRGKRVPGGQVVNPTRFGVATSAGIEYDVAGIRN